MKWLLSQHDIYPGRAKGMIQLFRQDLPSCILNGQGEAPLPVLRLVLYEKSGKGRYFFGKKHKK